MGHILRQPVTSLQYQTMANELRRNLATFKSGAAQRRAMAIIADLERRAAAEGPAGKYFEDLD
jgi:hypothetical protein